MPAKIAACPIKAILKNFIDIHKNIKFVAQRGNELIMFFSISAWCLYIESAFSVYQLIKFF